MAAIHTLAQDANLQVKQGSLTTHVLSANDAAHFVTERTVEGHEGIELKAEGQKGASIQAHGLLAAPAGGVKLTATTQAGDASVGVLGGTQTGPQHGLELTAHSAAGSGKANVRLGNVTAGGDVRVACHGGSAHIKTGNIRAKSVHIRATATSDNGTAASHLANVVSEGNVTNCVIGPGVDPALLKMLGL